MKACLMKVNYDPKYTTPHSHKPYQSLHVRLNVAKDIYSTNAASNKTRKKETLGDECARTKYSDKRVISSTAGFTSGKDSSKCEKRQKQIPKQLGHSNVSIYCCFSCSGV